MPLSSSQHSNPGRRVVVTGAGIITALGSGWEANARGFREGRRAFRDVTLFDVSRNRAKQAAEVDLPGAPDGVALSPRRVQRMDRATRLLLHSAWEAWKQSRSTASGRVPMVFGVTSAGMTQGQDYYREVMTPGHSDRGQPSRILNYLAERQLMEVGAALGISGPQTIIANACASGANAIGHAFFLIRSGFCEQVLTGGYDGLSQLVFTGFDSLQALSTTVCRPFDQNRDGLALGEGAATLTLESLEHAERRGAEILGEIAGYGATTDMHHLTQPHPEGDAAYRAMILATKAAGISPEDIGYINAHGTGTPLNDSSETAAINRFGAGAASQLRVSSTKASIGHTLGAAGAVETVVCLMALRGGWLPPTRSTETPEPSMKFRLIRQPEAARCEWALTNSFGFGGANASLIVRRFP